MGEIAYCGLKCTECPMFIETENDDNTMRDKLAKEYSTKSCTFKREDINCYGCHCSKADNSKMCGGCEIRKCGQANNLDNCGQCKKYPCKLIKKFVPKESEGRITLNEINTNLYEKIK